MYEVSPDYGMITQAWNIYAVAVPIVEHFFGIQPKAYEKKITIKPLMPSDWKIARLSNVRIGDNQLSIEKSTEQDVGVYIDKSSSTLLDDRFRSRPWLRD